MVILKEPALAAAFPAGDTRTASNVARLDFALHGCRNLPRTRIHRCRRALTLHFREPRSFQVFEKRAERALDDRRWIAIRDRMPEQILKCRTVSCASRLIVTCSL